MQTNNITPEQRAVMIGEVILEARSIESKLHKICGTSEVAGIHALTELLANKLPEDLKNQLHYIATIRNHAAHEESFVQSIGEFKSFQNCVREVKATLERLYPEQDAPQTEQNDAQDDWEKRVAVERELCEAMTKKLSTLGFIPVLGNVYLIYVLLLAVFYQGFLVLLAGLYACSIVLGYEGWQSAADRGLLYVGAGAFAFAYIAVAVLWYKSPVRRLPKALGIVPVLNAIYLPVRWLRDLHWGKFLISSFGIALFIAGVVLLLKGIYNYGALAIALNWVCSLTAAVLRGKKL